MFEIHANDNFDAAIENVFARLSDHEQFLGGPGVDSCRVTRSGDDERNGLGAIREVCAGPLRFEEEIVRFEPPHRYDYRIKSVTLFGRPVPMHHELGWLELQEAAGLVRVDWFSRFDIPLPLVGGAIEKQIGARLRHTFEGLLQRAQGSV